MREKQHKNTAGGDGAKKIGTSRLREKLGLSQFVTKVTQTRCERKWRQNARRQNPPGANARIAVKKDGAKGQQEKIEARTGNSRKTPQEQRRENTARGNGAKMLREEMARKQWGGRRVDWHGQGAGNPVVNFRTSADFDSSAKACVRGRDDGHRRFDSR
eukprot:6181354-Pleurochrysis_carterae.AAC.1